MGKTFDIINQTFLKKALYFFKFGNDIQRWFAVIYMDILGSIINDGHALSIPLFELIY